MPEARSYSNLLGLGWMTSRIFTLKVVSRLKCQKPQTEEEKPFFLAGGAESLDDAPQDYEEGTERGPKLKKTVGMKQHKDDA
ncbi:hypothetical protein O6P43_024286 [Quillaja saponaria]|uniref:Uncharacterized protein n=1 Tax=Quillaja saponaria TaxID=32244 RepID=A0AAD7PF13_QUISA|nr:hypothetical protein O6P43_024286 [Quillaja saponaria]